MHVSSGVTLRHLGPPQALTQREKDVRQLRAELKELKESLETMPVHKVSAFQQMSNASPPAVHHSRDCLCVEDVCQE